MHTDTPAERNGASGDGGGEAAGDAGGKAPGDARTADKGGESEPVPPDGSGRASRSSAGAPTGSAGAASRRTVLKTVAAGAATTALSGVAVGRVGGEGDPAPASAGARGDPAPTSTGTSLQGGDGEEGPICLKPRETGTDRSVACKYRLTNAGEDCPTTIYGPCGSTEDPCPWGGREVTLPESGCSGTLQLAGQYCTTPVPHDVKYWPVPCGDEEPKSVVVTNFLLVGVLRSNPDVLAESGSSIPFSEALHGQTIDVVIDGDGAPDVTTHSTVEVGENGRITDARVGEPRDPDYRVKLDEATANDVVAAEQPVDVAKRAYASGRIQVTPVSGGILQRTVVGVVETVVQVGAGLVPGLGG